MKALILAAGSGRRLLPHTETTPKCLVQVGGISILRAQVWALQENGITDITVMTGYLAEQVEATFAGECNFQHNPAFANTGSLHTMLLARESFVGQPFVLLNSDLFFDAPLLETLLRHPTKTSALVDRNAKLLDGEMNVAIKHGRITRFSKSVPAAEAQALSLQIVKFGAEESSFLFDQGAKRAASSNTQLFPASVYPDLIQASIIYPVQRSSGFWAEIDTPEDLENARSAYAAYSRHGASQAGK